MSDFYSVGLFKYFHGEFLSLSFNFCLRRSDVAVALVTHPSVLEIIWISLNVNDMWEYLRDVTLGTVRLHNMQDQRPRLPRGVVPLICKFFPGPIGSRKSPLFTEKMSCKTKYAYCSLRDRQSELMIFVSAIAYRPTSLPFISLSINPPDYARVNSAHGFIRKIIIIHVLLSGVSRDPIELDM
jgi:hypothetical protein